MIIVPVGADAARTRTRTKFCDVAAVLSGRSNIGKRGDLVNRRGIRARDVTDAFPVFGGPERSTCADLAHLALESMPLSGIVQI